MTAFTSKASKLLYTCVIFYLFLQLALRFGLVGPSMLDMQDNLQVTYQQISTAFSAMCIGICVGAVSTGLISKIIKSRELSAAILMGLTSVLVACITFLPSYVQYLICNFAVGVTSGAAISTCEAWVLEIWGKDCGPYMQALQFFRGLGYIVGPILADPFLSPDAEIEFEVLANSTTTPGLGPTNSSTTELPQILTDSAPYNYRIRYPYIINSVLLALGAFLLIGLWIFRALKNSQFELKKETRTESKSGKRTESIIIGSIDANGHVNYAFENTEVGISSKETSQEMGHTQKEFPEELTEEYTKTYTVSMIVLASVFYLFFYEEVIVTYIPSFCTQIHVHLTKSEASLLTSIFNLSNLIGKAICVVLALKVSHVKMLYLNLSIMMASLVLLIAFADYNRTVLWIGMCMLGVGLSSIIASLYTLLEDSVRMSPLMCGILNMAGTLGSVITPLIIGPFMEKYPMILLYISLVYTVLCAALVLMMQLLLGYKHKFRVNPTEGAAKCYEEVIKEKFEVVKRQGSIEKY